MRTTLQKTKIATLIKFFFVLSFFIFSANSAFAAFPAVVSTASGNSGANAVSTAITMPTGVTTGDLLMVFFMKDGTAAPTSITGTGWTGLTGTSEGTIYQRIYWKIADGSDTLTINHASEGTAYVSYRITGFDPMTAPALGTAVTGTSINPNPPNLVPSWGTADTLWISAYGWDANRSHTSYPANFTTNQVTNRWANTAGSGIAVSTRSLNTSSQDPGTAVISASDGWIAQTLAVRPVPLSISGTLYSDEGITAITTGKTIKMAIGTSTVSVHSTTTNSGTGNFNFYIDDSAGYATGTPIIVWVDGDAIDANHFTKASSTADIVNLDLYQNTVIVSHEASSTATSTSNSDLSFYDSDDDSDIQYTANSGDLTVADGQELHVLENKTFSSASTSELTLDDFHIATSSVFLQNGASTTISGDIVNDGLYQSGASNWSTTSVPNISDWDDVVYGNGLFVATAVGGATGVMTSPDGITWTNQTIPSVSPQFFSITYGNGLFVGVARNGTNRIITSPDGVNWTDYAALEDNQWYIVEYGDGKFVSLSSDGTNQVMYSADGVNWSTSTSAAARNWRGLVYGNEQFVAVANSGSGDQVMTSPDGITWTGRPTPADKGWLSVTYGNGMYVAVAYNTATDNIMTSPDGINWTARTAPDGAGTLWTEVNFINGLFIAISKDGAGIMTSPDGVTWTAQQSPDDSDWDGIAFGNNRLVAVSHNGTSSVMYSILGTTTFDGSSAQTISGSSTATFAMGNLEFTGSDTVTFEENIFASDFDINSGATVVAPEQLKLSGDFNNDGTFTRATTSASDWTLLTSIEDSEWESIAYGNGTFVAIGDTGSHIMYSNNGTTWATTSVPEDNNWAAITYGNGQFVATANGGTNQVMTSPNGVDWTVHSASANNSWRGIAYGNGVYVAVANGGTNRIMYSYDGESWTGVTAPADGNSWYPITYGNGTFVALSSSGSNRAMTSPDGINWSSHTTATDDSWRGIAYGNGVFVGVSTDGTVMTSPDGASWTSRTPAEANEWWEVEYGDGLFVAVANSGTNRVMTSPDGINWVAQSTGEQNNFWDAIAYGNGRFVAAACGVDATVCNSTAGSRVMVSDISSLTMTGADPTISGTLTGTSELGNLKLEGKGTTTIANNAKISELIIDTSILSAPTTLTIEGNLVNYRGTFEANSGTVVFNSTEQQTVEGKLTATSSFNNLTVDNQNKNGTSSQSVIFLATTTVDGTFTVTASSSVALKANATSTFNNVVWNGGSTTTNPVWITSTNNGTQAGVEVTGSYAIYDAMIRDINACGSVSLTATNSVNISNNNCITFVLGEEALGSTTISEHTDSQVNNNFNFQNKTNEPLFAFKLTPTPADGTTTVSSLVLTLSGVKDVDVNDFSNLRLYRDHDNDADYDVSDTQIGGDGAISIIDSIGTVTFSTSFEATTTENYVLIGDWNSPSIQSQMNIDLLQGGIVATDVNGVQTIFGNVDHVQHSRLAVRKGGGGGSSSAVGDPAPEGDGDVGGGGNEGGGEIDTNTGGQLMGDNPNYRWPSANSGDVLSNPSYIYDRNDGTYATQNGIAGGSDNNKFTGYNLVVPGTNTIEGVEVKLEVSATTNAGDIDVELSWNGGTNWTVIKTTPTLTTTDTVVTLGGPSDKWGRASWATTDFSNANFVVRLTGNISSNTIQIDAMQVRVYHQATGGGAGGGGGI